MQLLGRIQVVGRRKCRRLAAAWERRLPLIQWGAAPLYVVLFAVAPRKGESTLAHVSFAFFMTTIVAWILTLIVLAWIDHMANDWDEDGSSDHGLLREADSLIRQASGHPYRHMVIRGVISSLSDDVPALGQELEASRFRRWLVPFAWFGARACGLGFALLLVLTVARWF